MRSVSLSKYLSKSIHFLTAFVYLFTFLGPSLAIATSTLTYTETIQEERVVTPLVVAPRTLVLDINNAVTPPEYQRFDLKITPEKSQLRQGVHFRFQNYDSPELSLGTFINFNGPFPHSSFSPLIQKDLQTGFTVSLPGFGQIQCDWDGNLKLVGLHTSNPETPNLALNLVTVGTVDLSNITFENLSIKAKKATFVKGISLQGPSVFDIESLRIDTSGVVNNDTMSFLSKTSISCITLWHNKGKILGDYSLDFTSGGFLNSGTVHSQGYLDINSPYLNNSRGSFIAERGVRGNFARHFFNTNGVIASNGLTSLSFGQDVSQSSLGDIRGQKVILEDLSGATRFSLKNGRVEGTQSTEIIGNHPSMPTVQFVTPQLFLDAPDFNLGKQEHVERTLVKRSKTQYFTLTKAYETDGTLEFWQRDIETRENAQAAMLERFGDEKGDMPKHLGVIDLQASVKAAAGLRFFTPHAKIRLGDAAKEEILEFIHDKGWLEAYATEFDLEKGALAAENAHVHAPGGILTGRLVRDETRDCFATFSSHSQCSGTHNLGADIANVSHTFLGETVNGGYDGRHLAILPIATSNGTVIQLKNQATLKGPWSHKGAFEAETLVLDTPKDSFLEAGQVTLSKALLFLQDGLMHLKRSMTAFNFRYYTYGAHRNGGGPATYNFVSSEPANLTVNGIISGSGTVVNQGSIFHAHEKGPDFQYKEEGVKTSLFQKFIPKEQFTSSELSSAVFTGGYYNRASGRWGDPIGITSATNSLWPVPRQCIPYAWGFLQKTNNFVGAEISFPAQTSFGTGVTATPDDRGITTVAGDFQAPLIIALIGHGRADIGSVPTLTRHVTHTHSPIQPLVPESFNLQTIHMSEGLRRLMDQKTQEESFFKFRPRFWFEAEKAQLFHTQLRPYVRVKNDNGGFDALTGQALFTLSPELLIKAVQDKALKVLGRGNINDNQKIDEDQILELHHNFVEYIEEIGFEGADLAGALMDPNSRLPMPKKPFICYQSMNNEEGISELSPIIWLPPEMHKKSGIQTRLLLAIPMGMSFNDLLAYAQGNQTLAPMLENLLTNHADMVPRINQLALTYREENGLELVAYDELPKAGPIAFNGGIEADIFMGFNTGTILNHADIKSQDIFLASFFGNVIMSSVVEREHHGNGNFQDRILAQARLKASNIIKIFAGQDIIFQGAETISEVSTHILALARIFDVPATLVSQRTEQLSGKYKGSETWMNIHNHVSRHSSGGSFKQEALGTQELCGGQYKADFIDILAEGDIDITDAVNHASHSFTGKSTKGFKSKKRSEHEQRQTSRGATFESRKAPTNIESRTGNLGITAPQFTGGHGATLSAPLGEVMIRLGRESFEKSSSSTMTSSTWNKMVQKTEKHLTFSVPTSDGPVKVKALKTIIETIQGKDLAFLEKLEVIDGELIKQAVAELHEYDETVVESLGGPAAAVIAIAVSCITAGAAGPAMIAALGQVIGSACAAGFASLASQAAVSLISNQGNLSKVAKEITSSQALRSLATSMVTAGLVAGAGELINGATTTAKSVGEGATTATTQSVAQNTTQNVTQSTVKATTKVFDIGKRIQAGLIRASAETIVNSTIGGKNFEDSIIAAARSGVANVAGGFLAHEWGLEYKDIDSQIDYFTHKLVHGIIGAGMGALSDGEALAGFIGGVVGEVVGEAYATANPEGFDTNAEDYDPSLRDSLKNKGEILTQVSAALAAAFLDQNPNVAACTAHNAVHENSFSPEQTQTHFQMAVEVEELQAELALETDLEKCLNLERRISRRQGIIETYEDKQAAYTELGEKYLTPVVDWGMSDIENEMYHRVIQPWNGAMDVVQCWTDDTRQLYSSDTLRYSPEIREGFNIDSTLSGINSIASALKLPTSKGGALLFALPASKTFLGGLKALGRGTVNALRQVPVFNIKNSIPVFDALELGGAHLKLLTGPMTTPSGRRYLPGVASFDGTLPKASSFPNWIRGSEGNAAKIPWEVANKLAGREFKTFDQFREALWFEVSKNPMLIQGFNAHNKTLMHNGRAPFAQRLQQVGKREKYELDHMQELQHGGNVYDMNNLIIRTPLNHIKGK